MGKLWTGGAAAIGLLLLILDAKTGIQGATDGLMLCIRSIIPSLLPFIFLSILLTGTISGRRVPFFRWISKILRIPNGSEGLFLMGLLGGYPVGAQVVALSYEDGCLTKKDAQRMLGFCSNAGPSFLFGIIACKFNSPQSPWALWAIHILSAVLCGVLLPGGSMKNARLTGERPVSAQNSLQKGLKIVAIICGWVILFRVAIAFLTRWLLWLLPVPVQVTIIGVLELANGCCSLDSIANEGLRFVICSGMLSFGGICVLMQTAAVTGKLGMGYYFPGKLLQCAISVILAAFYQSFAFRATDRVHISVPILTICCLAVVFIPIFLSKIQKKCSIPAIGSV